MKKKRNMENYWKKKAEAYRDYSIQLRNENSDLKERLKDLAVGLLPSHIANNTWSMDTKLQYSAASKLKELSTKSVKEPEGYFYP